jgi:hypothetical protein
MLVLGFGGNGRIEPSAAGVAWANTSCGVAMHRLVASINAGDRL